MGGALGNEKIQSEEEENVWNVECGTTCQSANWHLAFGIAMDSGLVLDVG